MIDYLKKEFYKKYGENIDEKSEWTFNGNGINSLLLFLSKKILDKNNDKWLKMLKKMGTLTVRDIEIFSADIDGRKLSK